MRFNRLYTATALALAIATPAWAATVSGKVVDNKGKGIANAEVSILQTRVVTDKNGEFALTDISDGAAELHVEARYFTHQNRNLTLAGNDVDNVIVTLTPSVMDVVDVYATPLHTSTMESALPVNVLGADELRLKQASTLGETLKNEVGVHSSYFGPVSSSPIIRGLDGPRVLITQNGLDAGDASRVGPDHIVSTETTTATQIEVLRGPATLFYGSGAIGGVVNVVDNRVPTELEQSVGFSLQHNSVADEDLATIDINTGTDSFAIHFDGFWREANDYKIPGVAELEHDEEHEEHEEEEHEEHEDNHSRLANTSNDAKGFTLGTSYLLDNGFVGFSYGRTDRTYGIPGHSHAGHDEHEEHDEELEMEEGHDEAHDEESVFGDLTQDRLQMLSDLRFDESFFNRVASKVAYTDYQHQEIENGEVGTTFKNELWEAKFDIYHREYNGFKGAWTVHYKLSDFEALGEEAFTPPSSTETLAFAWLEEKHFGDVLLQLGARIEHVTLEPVHGHDEHEAHDEHELDEHEEHEELELAQQDFTPISASLGLVWDYQPGYNLGMSAAFSQRAPSAAELFSNGPHIGTNSFELGALFELHEEDDGYHVELSDQDVDVETSYNLDLTWRKFSGDLGFVASVFYNHTDDFYYQQDTGFVFEDSGIHDHGDEHDEGHGDEHDEELTEDHAHDEEGLPIFVYRQDDVDMYGFEAELVYQLSAPLKANIFTDYIRAKLSDGGNLPRIPPLRLGAGLQYQANNFAAGLDVTHYFEQDQLAQLETETDSYTMVDLHANYYLDGIGDDTVLFLKVDNVFDTEARVHSSFLKNIAPLPGRGITLGVRASF
ncbi:TonB-dependent receptor [Thalassotalea litorea]|uniref:TonB-dependent receptor n=1 Tax=Thalassotalea litorea TaxID=2020715 RepID=A0A5R9IPG0_9GAMM|nr:TonB-dependent receptor [Thalassotalea litorea]TLU67162.1 TonB-dependent receptor [Thalassotalea litorea]